MSSSTEFPLGVYAGNPNGNDPSAEASFEAQYQSFVNTMGAAPQFMDTFVDSTQDPSQWDSNAAWTAWSWASSPDAYDLTPVIGVPMGDNNSWSDPDQFFQAIISGQYDSIYKGIVDAWASEGFSTLYLRLGYEMNVDGYNSWYMGDSPSTIADWVAAFQHLSTLLKAEGTADGVNVQIVWNPVASSLSESSQQVLSSYPGNQYVDVIGTDMYSPVEPSDLYDWADNNGTTDSSLSQWFANPLNRVHYWNYPSATPSDPTDQSGAGWSLDDAIQLAQETGKPLGIAETGAGGNATYGPTDDPAFPAWLASSLAQSGVPIAFVNIWDDQVGDGNWDFSSTTADKPQEAAAWAQYFGAASAYTTSPTPLVMQNGTEDEVIEANAPNSVVTFTDTAGDTFVMPAIASGSQDWYTDQTNLEDNVHQWVDSSGAVNVWTDSWGLVNTVSLADTSGRSFVFSNFVETDANLSGAPIAAGEASTFTVNTAQRGNISLGSGNYKVTFNAFSNDDTPSDNVVTLTEGSGNDTFTLNGYEWATRADVYAGSGDDVMNFVNTGPVQAWAGTGNDTVTAPDGWNTITASTGILTVTGGGGNDTYVFAPGDGAMTVNDFLPQQGDILQISSALQPDLHEANTSAGLVLSFGSSAGTITLPDLHSLPSSSIHWT